MPTTTAIVAGEPVVRPVNVEIRLEGSSSGNAGIRYAKCRLLATPIPMITPIIDSRPRVCSAASTVSVQNKTASDAVITMIVVGPIRSEERRVGEEGRYRR